MYIYIYMNTLYPFPPADRPAEDLLLAVEARRLRTRRL